MTPEERTFVARLRRSPFDAITRLVYADWLADHDRYEDEDVQRRMTVGYRAIRAAARRPCRGCNAPWRGSAGSTEAGTCFEWWKETHHPLLVEELEHDWYALIVCDNVYLDGDGDGSKDFLRLYLANDAAARAFSFLTPERQDEIIKSPKRAPPTRRHK